MSKAKWLSLPLASSILAISLAACGQSGNSLSPGATAPASSTASAAVSPSAETGAGASASASPTASPSAAPSESAAPSAQASSQEPQTISLGTPSALRMVDFKSGWAGGDGWIAHTGDGGKTWQSSYKTDRGVLQIFALNDKLVWATLGAENEKTAELVSTKDGGKTWNAVGQVPGRDFLHFVNENEAFSGKWTTKDGGKTWTALAVPNNLVGDVYFHDRSNGWAVTQTSGKKFSFLHTQDGGKTWKTVYDKAWDGEVNGAVIRSAGKSDAWIELIGGTGMTQTAYSLFHTADGGKTWKTVVANNTAGGGPAPGFKMDDKGVPAGPGNSPGTLYVVDTKTAFLGGQCSACDKPNTLGHTADGGKTWVNEKPELPGYGQQLIAAADAKQVWWVLTDAEQPSIMYTTQDSGAHWSKAYTFEKPKNAS